MSSHYHASHDPQRTLLHFGAAPPVPHGIQDMWPGLLGVFIRRATLATQTRQALAGLFELLPHWSQHCIIPADAIFEPDFRNGKPVPTRITLAGGEPMGIAGLWACGSTPKGDVYSFTMLTVNADQHTVMRSFRQSHNERRMVVILPPERYQDWLDAPAEHSQDFMRAHPAQGLQVEWSTT
jgi:putative SOS response-associated peptidase YedK